MSEIAAAKKALRLEAVLARDRAAADSGPWTARRASANALGLIAPLDSRARVAAYLPMRSEIDTAPLLLALHGLEFRLCLPVVAGPGAPLEFRAWMPGDALAEGAFGTRQPASGAAVVPQVLIVPLLAFDDACYRLGYGGGYYDRTLAALRAGDGEIHAFGLAFAGQRIAALPREATDARLDAVITEAGVVRHG